MSARDDFLGRAYGLIISLHGDLSPDELHIVYRLIDHGEIGEAMVELAWIIVNGDKRISQEVYERIAELSAGLVNEDHMPETFADHVIAGE